MVFQERRSPSARNNSAALISAIGRSPIHGKTSRSRRLMIWSAWDLARFAVEYALNHSRATTLKPLEARSALVAFCSLRCSPGPPSTSSLRAAFRRARASLRPTSGSPQRQPLLLAPNSAPPSCPRIAIGATGRFWNEKSLKPLLVQDFRLLPDVAGIVLGGQSRNRTTDTRIFNPLLYQLS